MIQRTGSQTECCLFCFFTAMYIFSYFHQFVNSFIHFFTLLLILKMKKDLSLSLTH